ncbi:MAG: DUF2339 domain-containing protein [Spirochaetia bacterium]|nr:DUF2339 domain-containing protein [Spirochaetia bacterium]
MNLEELNARVQRLEEELTIVKGELARASASPAGSSSGSRVTASSTVAPGQGPVSTPKPAGPGFFERLSQNDNLEVLLGGNILGKLGLLAIVLAVSWFIKLAFDNQWVNESGRIYTGILIGFAVMTGGLYLAKLKTRVIPAPLFGTGVSILYISIFSAYHFYNLLNLPETFLAMVLLSAFVTTLAVKADRQSLYVFGLLGSFLAPVMLSRGENSYRFLFTYIALIQVGFLWVSWHRTWRLSAYLVLFATSVMWSIWASKSMAQSGFVFPMGILLFTMAVYYARDLMLSIKHKKEPTLSDLVILPLASVLYAISGFYLTQHHYPDLTAHFLLALTLLMAGFYLLRAKYTANGIGFAQARTIAFYQIIVFLFASLTDFFDGRMLTTAWILFSASLSLGAVRLKSNAILIVSLLAWCASLFRLIFIEYSPVPYQSLLNARFVLYVIAGIGLTLTYLIHKRNPFTRYVQGFAFAAMFVFVWGTLLENRDTILSEHYRNLGYSYVLALYALGFLVYGFWKDHRTMRLSGIFLAVLVVLKLYGYDIWTMGRLVRIIAGFSLGVALLALSILYQKYRDKIMKISKDLVILLLGPVALAMALAAPNSLNAETFRPGSYKSVTGLKERRPGSLGDSKIQYGRADLTNEILRTGSSSIRVAWNGKALPYFIQRVGEDTSRDGRYEPEVVFTEATRDSRVYVLKLPELPEGMVWSQLDLSSGGIFESGVQVETGNKPGEWDYLGHRSVFRYGDQSDTQIRIDAGTSRYVRLTFNKNIPLTFPAVHSTPGRSKEVAFEIPTDQIKVSNDSDRKGTVYEFANPEKRKIERMVLVFEEQRFDRGAEILTYNTESKSFSTNTSAGLLKRAKDKPEQVLDLANPANDVIKILVLNGDDEPLHLKSIMGFSPVEQIIFQLPAAEEYLDATKDGKTSGISIYSGNPYIGSPAYDLQLTFDSKTAGTMAQFQAESTETNKDFAYSAMEPPVSSWIIRIVFYLGLIALIWPCIRIFQDYSRAA